MGNDDIVKGETTMEREEMKKYYKDMLREVTVEKIQEAQKAVAFFSELTEDKDAPELSKQAKGAFIATLLIEYGKILAAAERGTK